MTAKAARQALIDRKGWTDEELPHVNTIGEILNRLGYKLRRVQKTKPLKKIKGTDAIFDNVRQENQAADDDPDVIRISMDAKAKVAVAPGLGFGEYGDTHVRIALVENQHRLRQALRNIRHFMATDNGGPVEATTEAAL